MTVVNFGGKLRELRLKRKLSQEKLAVKANLTPAIIQSLERGRRTRPRLDTILALAGALEIPPGELIGETPEPHQFTMEDMNLVKTFEELAPVDREALLEFARLLLQKSRLARELEKGK